jgi:RNA polymerase sigma-70 factor (ECF subfamily)
MSPNQTPPRVSDTLRNGSPEFPTTHWTLVMRVGHGGEVRRAALEELCGLYWYPIYVYLRRRGYRQHDAEDITQGFFLKLLEDQTLDAASAGKGRLRSFLLAAVQRHLADLHRAQNAMKRGGGKALISFDEMNAEERYNHEPVDLQNPESLFTRVWAKQLLASVQEKLKVDLADGRRPQIFEALLPFLLLEEDPPSYREVAARLQATEVSVRILVSRLRQRFRDLLREEVAQTVGSASELETEMAWLYRTLSAG